MDTQTQAKADVSGMINEIKDYMPAVYAAIKARAAVMGNGAFELVRRGLRGEPGCFWALEGGRVVGTPFHGHAVMTEVGKALVEFGCAYVCIWPDQPPITGLPRPQGGSHGAA